MVADLLTLSETAGLAGVEGGNAIYDSNVAPLWGSNVTKWKHTVWYRGFRNLHTLIGEYNADPLAILCDCCHAKGILMVAGSWANFQGNTRELASGLGRTSDWVFDHTEQYACGDTTLSPPPPVSPGPGSNGATKIDPLRFSWLHQPVRQRRFAEFEELLSRYTTDGVEVNFVDFAPLCRFDEVEAVAPLVTQWLRDLRKVAEAASAAQQRRKRVLVRVPADPAAWAALGYDVVAWVREDLVDSLVCTSGQTESTMQQDLALGAAIALCAEPGNRCNALASISVNLLKPGLQYARGPDIHAAAANAYAQGAGGVGLGNAWWGPHGWPWLRDEYTILRPLAHPDLLAAADKNYRVRAAGPATTAFLPGDTLPLPAPLDVGQPAGPLEFRVAEHGLAAAAAEGKVASCRLKVRLGSVDVSFNDILVRLNDRPLPSAIATVDDLGYRTPSTGGGPYGGIWAFELPLEHYPRSNAVNSVQVELLSKPTEVDFEYSVVDVTLEIRYRLHRHFSTDPAGVASNISGRLPVPRL